MGNDITHRQSPPAAKLPACLRQGAEDQRPIQRVQPPYDARQEGRDEIAFGPRSPDCGHDERLDSAYFHFNIEKLLAVSIQNVFERRRHAITVLATLLNPPEGVPAQDQPVEFWIMAENRLTVARTAHVKLESMGAMVQGKIKCRQSIFWRIVSRTAMSEK